ncbi:MAG: CBS domain-containing protein [Proteobacteria bacterium]|nr:CBS domain-containing protein [Pseudomonadota bacterium]MBU1688158.1 CBS domain-containing protein [Pseudomonadota bacterium]
MFGKLVRDFRPYETASQVTSDAELASIVRSFVHVPSLHHVCVVDDQGRLLGLVNRKRLFKSIFSHYVAADSRVSKLLMLHLAETSGDIMFTHVITTNEDEEIATVISKMIDKNIREIPVLDENGGVIGLLSLLILMQKWLAEQEGG